MASHTRNPTGKNQHNLPSADDATLKDALLKYHREKLTNNRAISEHLKAEYNIIMSATTVKRRRRELNLKGSGATMKQIPYTGAEQLVVAQMDKDPSKHAGPQTIQSKIAFEKGVHLPRDFVSEIMHIHDEDGFRARDPTSKRILRFAKVPVGIHERWAGDGHDKLYKIGFPIWAIVDDATGRWLGGWVVPSNRMGDIVAYLFLCCVELFGGVPIQFSTDCGSETTKLYGLANALREIFHPEYDLNELPAHVFLRSVRNISIERSWLRLRLDFGDNAVLFFLKGIDEGLYNPEDPQQYDLCQWLWPVLLRKELKSFVDFRNCVRMRKDKEKPGPSGMSRNEAFSLPEKWGGRNCLLPVDVSVIREIKSAMGGDALLEFVSPEFSECAQIAYDSLNISELTFQNVWTIFTAMYPLVYPD